jgi:carbon storage regulator CsrA
MLVLTRAKGDSLVIGDCIRVTVVECRGDKVRLAITAPVDVSVHRKEVYDVLQLFPGPWTGPQSAFLQAILEDPADDSVRLIFADWLDDQGDPRGELIRAQCQAGVAGGLPETTSGRGEVPRKKG